MPLASRPLVLVTSVLLCGPAYQIGSIGGEIVIESGAVNPEVRVTVSADFPD